ncbi:hypothetical protein BRADI_3g11031v3 [Brachypodium distachyon]|uniref:Myb/SANT-like domain-containing protein n=1 Tax=Brachypodium distachyon TaxID=15368 RepID=A0A2K2CWJ3_BRADI|nr:hypothetical protein BRADI_3g11031v3 [Brachypodium distachyon]
MESRKKGGTGYLTWSDSMDKALLDVFVERYNKGDRAQNGWKPRVYIAAVKNVREKCEMEITMENIISRSKTFDKYHAIISKMLSQSGFGWDWDNNKISVDSDDVWNTYVHANKDATSYRHKTIKFWDMISLVYSKDRANGAGARTAAESAAEMAAENGNNSKDTDATSSTQVDGDRKKKRYRSDDSIASMLGEKLDNFTAAFQADVCEPPPKPASPEEILAALDAIPGLGEDDVLAAYEILVSNDHKFKSLQALPGGMKKKWILKQVNPK